MSTETNTNDVSDPRALVTHDIESGQTYVDSRTDDELLVVFASSDVVLLRDLDDDGSRLAHRLDTRDAFEANVGSGRYELSGNEAVGHGASGKLRSLIDRYDSQDGRKAAHYVTALNEALQLIEGSGRADDNEEVDFESVSGIGAGTASNLRANGYRLKKDIRGASDDELLDVSGIGQGNLSNLRDHVG